MPKGSKSHYKKEARKRDTPICPECGNQAREANTQYGIRAMCCGLWSWDRYPLADAETHGARQTAHEWFDDLWKSGLIERREAYGRLRQELNLGKHDCHIKLMDRKTAERVPDAVLNIRQTVEGQ